MKIQYAVHLRYLKQALNHRLILRKYFLKLMNNVVFRKTMENVTKLRSIKLVTTGKRKDYLVSELNYHTTQFFTHNLLEMEIRKT